ncbi:MAG: HIT domain-containing protein [Gammaproteobacteria bacterium]|nr:HIT domain-containing protein [Gammaproteobacteria bacterium]
MDRFTLHPQLAADCHLLGNLPLSRVLLLDDARYPWLILVPQRPNLREIYELEPAERQQLVEESSQVGKVLMSLYAGDKLNIGALGNLVPQLHLHHIVRRQGDPAWPGPVWGDSPAQRYGQYQLAERMAQLRAALPELA